MIHLLSSRLILPPFSPFSVIKIPDIKPDRSAVILVKLIEINLMNTASVFTMSKSI